MYTTQQISLYAELTHTRHDFFVKAGDEARRAGEWWREILLVDTPVTQDTDMDYSEIW